MLDFYTAVHDNFQAGSASFFGGRFIDDADLHPQHFRVDGDGVIGQRRNVAGFSKTIHHVDRAGNIAQAFVTLLSENFLVLRIHRNNSVAVINHIFRGEIARPMPLRREADDRDDFAFFQDAPQGLNISHSKNLIFNFAIDILSFFGMPDRRMDAASQHGMPGEASVMRLTAR